MGRPTVQWRMREVETFATSVNNYQQQLEAACTGGHGTLPKEQNTQQSPGLGLSLSPHRLQS
jgi:hypothetical protein